MERTAKTCHGTPVPALGGTGFRLMPSLSDGFLAKNSSNNLHINKLFIISLIRGRRSRALRYNFSPDRQKVKRLLFLCPESQHGLFSGLFSFSPFRPLAAEEAVPFHVPPNMNVSIERGRRKLASYAEREESRMKFNVTI